MPSVYDHFTSNLADIIRAGRSRGAGIVLSTVAVNLRDCPPFGSAHPATLSETGRKRWDELYQLGIQAQARGDHEAALRQFAEAQAIDANHAELRYREGRSALALHQASTAREHFGAARDLDTLRFRCDSTLNAILRQFATNGILGTGVLVDAERAFADASPAGLPGKEMFYEHVHLTFPGNYLLARTIAAAVESQLPETALPGSTHASWPTEDECARRLGWSEWTRLAALQAILNRKRSAPFIAQADHEVELRELSAQVELLSVAQQSNGLAAGRRACALALAEAPDDAVLLGSLSVFEQLEGDSAAAFHSIQRQLDLVPGDPVAWQRLGLNLVGQRRFDEAATAFRRALELNPADPGPRLNLGQVLRQAGQREQAVTELRQAVKTRRNFALAWLTLGEVYGEMGNTAEADSCYQHALTGGPYRVTDLTVLARFCRSRGWNEAAVTNYNQAVVVSPHDAKLRVEFGQFLLALRRDQDAGEQLAEAVKLSPNAVPARHLYGLILGQQGLPAEAEVQLREAQRLAPDRLEATMDLGMALLAQGKSAEALAQFESVLQRNPTNELALRYAQKLRAQSGPPGP